MRRRRLGLSSQETRSGPRSKFGRDASQGIAQRDGQRFEVAPETIRQAITSVRNHYTPSQKRGNEAEERNQPGQFTYTRGGGATTAMAACGVVCMQEFGQYDDWRIFKSMEFVNAAILKSDKPKTRDGKMPFDSYTMYYVGQALYQVGGQHWREGYPILRDHIVAAQIHKPGDDSDGKWVDTGRSGKSHLGGKEGDLYGTSVACFILAIPNRYLPFCKKARLASSRKKNKEG